MSNPVLEVENLIKDYDAFRAVDSISFTVAKGQVMGLLGPNGAGKSTTIQMLLGITVHTAGNIRYFGSNFFSNRQKSLQRINFASAYNSLQGRIPVKENLLVFAGLYQVKSPLSKIAELLEYFEISHLANHKYWDLSAGERTRVNLIKALLNDPELILMDEPTASLDPDIADKTLTLIENLRNQRELSILFTSHNMSEVTRICDEVIFLNRGRIVSKGTPANHINRLQGAELTLRYKGDRKLLEELLSKHSLTYELMLDNRVVIKTANDKIASIIASVAKEKITIIDTEVKKPTLEDVFLEIARREKK